MNDGAGTISITVDGVTSNTIPFTITTGTIYFISVSDGDNSYNGLYSTRTGHSGSDGPFKDLLKFDPANNPSGDGQYICYIKAGTYTAIDSDGTFVYVNGPTGGSTKQKALISYPAEVPLINNAGQNKIFRSNSDGLENSYYTYSKLYATGGIGLGGAYGDYWRIVGNHFKDMLTDAWTGVIWVNASRYVYIYGNISENNGYDQYKHDVYIKSQAAGAANIHVQYVYLGWNEFKDPYAGAAGYGGCIFVSRSSDSGTDTRDIYIHDNYFHGGNNDFIYTGDSTAIYNIYIYNNTFSGNTSGHAVIYIYFDTTNIYIYNNTFYNTIPGDDIISNDSGLTTTTKNNIFYANNSQVIFHRSSGSIVSDHDLFYGEPVPSGTGITVTNPVTGDPQMVDPVNLNFHLQAASAARNAGTSDVSSIVTKDHDGNSRPQESIYDIGAYEYTIGAVGSEGIFGITLRGGSFR